jgi:hypothetical protein
MLYVHLEYPIQQKSKTSVQGAQAPWFLGATGARWSSGSSPVNVCNLGNRQQTFASRVSAMGTRLAAPGRRELRWRVTPRCPGNRHDTALLSSRQGGASRYVTRHLLGRAAAFRRPALGGSGAHCPRGGSAARARRVKGRGRTAPQHQLVRHAAGPKPLRRGPDPSLPPTICRA